jgi:hypothetical protein
LTRRTARAPEDWPDVKAAPAPTSSDSLEARRLPPLGQSVLGLAIALDTHYTGCTSGLDPRTATVGQANEYLTDRAARLWRGLYAHSL